MMSLVLPLRPLSYAPRPHGRRGFSLVELMAVVFIIGIIFIIGGGEILRTWKRQKVQSAATDIKILFQRALPEMQRRNMQTFIQVGPLTTVGAATYMPIYLIGDANGNGAIDPYPFVNPPTGLNPDLLIAEYDIKGTTGVDQEFSLSELDVTQVKSTLWSYNLTDWDNPRVLRCDFQGRTINPILGASGLQIVAPATLVFTHVDVVRGSLMPPTRYVISINPVWSVRVAKQINATPSNPNTWVTQNG